MRHADDDAGVDAVDYDGNDGTPNDEADYDEDDNAHCTPDDKADDLPSSWQVKAWLELAKSGHSLVNLYRLNFNKSRQRT